MTKKQTNYWAQLFQISDNLEGLVSEFEMILKSREIQTRFRSIMLVYMHQIIIGLWMILSDSENDDFTLHKLKKNFNNNELQRSASKILSEHKDLIGKIKKNRHKISAHLDSNFVAIKFSDDTVDSLEKQFEVKLPLLRANDKTNERYTPDDMKRDLPEIKVILLNVKKILSSLPQSVKS